MPQIPSGSPKPQTLNGLYFGFVPKKIFDPCQSSWLGRLYAVVSTGRTILRNYYCRPSGLFLLIHSNGFSMLNRPFILILNCSFRQIICFYRCHQSAGSTSICGVCLAAQTAARLCMRLSWLSARGRCTFLILASITCAFISLTPA